MNTALPTLTSNQPNVNHQPSRISHAAQTRNRVANESSSASLVVRQRSAQASHSKSHHT